MCPSCATPVLGSVIENHPCKKITDSTSAMGFHWTCHSSAICKRNADKYAMQLNEWANSGASRWVVASFCVKGVANTSKLPRYKRIIQRMGWEPINLCLYFFMWGPGVHGGIYGHISTPTSIHTLRGPAGRSGILQMLDLVVLANSWYLYLAASNYHGSCRLKPTEALIGCFLLRIQHVAWVTSWSIWLLEQWQKCSHKHNLWNNRCKKANPSICNEQQSATQWKWTCVFQNESCKGNASLKELHRPFCQPSAWPVEPLCCDTTDSTQFGVTVDTLLQKMIKIWSSRANMGKWQDHSDDSAWMIGLVRLCGLEKLGFYVLILFGAADTSLLSVRSQLLRWVLLTVDRDQHGPVTRLYNFGRWPSGLQCWCRLNGVNCYKSIFFWIETVEEILHLRQLKPINKTEISTQDWRKGSWLSLKSAPSASPTEIW